ncbi:MAG: 30S ribosomal protein S6, partial [Ruthenibacterium sp.]
GSRKLAYPINDETDGIYTLIKFTCEPDFPAELDRVYKITDGVLRSLILAIEPETAKKAPAKAETTEAE